MADDKDDVDASKNHKHHIAASGSPSGKRSKREWLAFHGTKHSRVGADFQVASLPVPGKNKSEKGKDEPSPKTTHGDDEAPKSKEAE